MDCEILETDGMEVNESLLTGESLAVQKRKGDFVYSGSDVVAGSAVAKVLHTGEENYATQLVKRQRPNGVRPRKCRMRSEKLLNM